MRRAALHDLPGAYRVCLLTGEAGRDASALYTDPDLLGHVYVGPYIVGEPGHALVVTDDAGVAGYCLAAPDTRAFEHWCEATWWPALRARYPLPAAPTPDGDLVRLLHVPERVPDAVVDAFPAHLHIDLLERAQGRGLGRALLVAQLDALRREGVPGLHLGVARDNERAIDFYRHLGFVDLEADDDVLLGIRLG